jgi:hypothetical protein
MTRIAALAATAALAVLTAGCGIGSADESKIAEVTGDYLTALADGDYAAACAELAPDAKPEGDCPAGVRASMSGIAAGEISDDNDGKLTLDVQGGSATARLESGATVELSRIAGEWLVSSPYVNARGS